MTGSRVNHLPPTHVVEEKPNGTPASNPNDPHHSAHPASPTPLAHEQNASRVPERRAARGNLLANSERNKVSGTGKTSKSQRRHSTGKTWNAGLAVACELVQALVQGQHGADGPTRRMLSELEKMIRPLRETSAQAPAAGDLVDKVIAWLRSDAPPGPVNGDAAAHGIADRAEPSTDLLKKLEALQADKADSNALGSYAVMAVMSAAAGIAESIKSGIHDQKRADESSVRVSRQVQEFAQRLPPLLKQASLAAANAPRHTELAAARAALLATAQAAMTAPFQYLQGNGRKGMTFLLSRRMAEWIGKVPEEGRASLEQLHATLLDFLDARIVQPE